MAARRLLFGQPKSVLPDQLRSILQSLLPIDRTVILAVNAEIQDLRLLEEMEVDLQPVCIIDTQKAAQTVLQLKRRYSLEDLLKTFSCPFKYLHTAGNDANFTLRALLMISARDLEVDVVGDSQKRLLSTLQAVAQSTRFKSSVWLEKSDEEDWMKRQEVAYGGTLEERKIKNQQKKARKLKKQTCKRIRQQHIVNTA